MPRGTGELWPLLISNSVGEKNTNGSFRHQSAGNCVLCDSGRDIRFCRISAHSHTHTNENQPIPISLRFLGEYGMRTRLAGFRLNVNHEYGYNEVTFCYLIYKGTLMDNLLQRNKKEERQTILEDTNIFSFTLRNKETTLLLLFGLLDWFTDNTFCFFVCGGWAAYWTWVNQSVMGNHCQRAMLQAWLNTQPWHTVRPEE